MARLANIRLTTLIPLAALVAELILLSASPASAADVDGMSKISPAVFSERQLKQRVAATYGFETIEGRAALRKAGLASRYVDRAQIAIYYHQEPDASEIDRLRSLGLRVNRELWIPPVPGKHPNGFLLAEAAYDALNAVVEKSAVVAVGSVERAFEPQNDLAASQIHADVLHESLATTYDGTGVSIAVLDSSLDLDHPDIPTPIEAYDVTDGIGIDNWGTDVSSTVSDHGTHVTGSALGRGTASGGTYQGIAPGASLYFYKIGNDVDATASAEDTIEAFGRVIELQLDVATMSYGAWTDFMDGSSPECQAVDAAVAAGTVVFIAAGNSQSDDQHDSTAFSGAGTVGTGIDLRIDNTYGAGAYTEDVYVNIVRADGTTGDDNLQLSMTNLGPGESLTTNGYAWSDRGTESSTYRLTPNVPAGETKTYLVSLTNSAAYPVEAHLYLFADAEVTFTTADPNSTVIGPALADEAIAVGAWVSRTSWTDWMGDMWTYGYTYDTLAPFSSFGPRPADGLRKPDLCAPGATVISCRDFDLSAPPDWALIDSYGWNNGTGSPDYTVKNGTSVACPMAAGAAALLLEAYPALTPHQVRTTLVSTARAAQAEDNMVGAGLIDILAAVAMDCNTNDFPDALDVFGGTSQDADSNGLPDECNHSPFQFGHIFAANPATDSVFEYDLSHSLTRIWGAAVLEATPTTSLSSVCFSADRAYMFIAAPAAQGGRYLYRISYDGIATRYDPLGADNGRYIQPTPAGTVIMSRESGALAELTVDGEYLRTLAEDDFGDDVYYDMAFTPSGELLLAGSWGSFLRWDFTTDSPLGQVVVGVPGVTVLTVDRAGNIYCGNSVNGPGGYGQVHKFSKDYTAQGLIFTSEEPVLDLDYDLLSDAIVVAEDDGTISLIDTNGALVDTIAVPGTSAVTAVATVHVPGYCGDANGDWRVDLTDYQSLADCVSGPGAPPADPLCVAFDCDRDEDVDLTDAALFQRRFTGPHLIDCNSNGFADAADFIRGVSVDCNNNNVPDECDLSDGASRDCNSNGVPDECDPFDCNANGIPDYCDIAAGTSSDEDVNGIPDSCEPPPDGILSWADWGKSRIERIRLDGTDRRLVTTPLLAAGVAVDPIGRDLYWIDPNATVKKMFRSAWDGSEVQVVCGGVSIESSSLSIDHTNGWLLWCRAHAGDGLIYAVRLNGSGFHTHMPSLDDPRAVAVDLVHGNLYWVEEEGRRLGRARLDGSHAAYLASLSGEGYGIAVDPSREYLYWTVPGQGTIYRSDLAASSPQPVVTGLGRPLGLAVDLVHGKLYWGDETTDRIQRANLDGSSIEDVVTSNVSRPCSLAITIPASAGDDCNGNGYVDPYDISLGLSDDCNTNRRPDECDIAGGTSSDDNMNSVPDECDTDCNENGFPDYRDLTVGTSLDCNDNRVPDECDTQTGASRDCNGDNVPDECETDCNASGYPDDCDVTAGTSLDCNLNGAPDECDLTAGLSVDCNYDSVPDECDIAAGTNDDCNANGTPDDCETTETLLFWSDFDLNRIERAALDGSNRTEVRTSEYPRGLAVDATERKLYWVDLIRYQIRRSDLDGTNIQTVLSSIVGASSGLAIDHAHGRLLWCRAQDSTGRIYRCDFDGTEYLTLISTLDKPTSVAVDNVNRKIYWIEAHGRRIGRADLDGSNKEYIASLPSAGGDIAVDPADGRLYWSVPGVDKIFRGNLDGTGAEEIVANLGAVYAIGIAVDNVAGKLYWGTDGDDKIQRANLDGSDVEDIITTGVDRPDRLVVYRGSGIGDCDGSGVLDECELASGTSPDCNSNSIPDLCDIAGGTSADVDSNGIPDECDIMGAWTDFRDVSASAAHEAGANGVGGDPVWYTGAVFDGRYVYSAPFRNGSGYHGEVLRDDTMGTFASPSSWAAYDPGNAHATRGRADLGSGGPLTRSRITATSRGAD